MRPFEFFILFCNNYDVLSCLVRVIALIVDGGFRQVRFKGMHLAQMPPAVAVLTQTQLRVVMAKVVLCQFCDCSFKLAIVSGCRFDLFVMGLSCLWLVGKS